MIYLQLYSVVIESFIFTAYYPCSEKVAGTQKWRREKSNCMAVCILKDVLRPIYTIRLVVYDCHSDE
jgi:hypothetical protein